MDLGQSQRGVDLGPGAVRYAHVASRLRSLGYAVEDHGNLSVPVRESFAGEGGEYFLPAILDACQKVYDLGRQALAEGCLPVFLVLLGLTLSAQQPDQGPKPTARAPIFTRRGNWLMASSW